MAYVGGSGLIDDESVKITANKETNGLITWDDINFEGPGKERVANIILDSTAGDCIKLYVYYYPDNIGEEMRCDEFYLKNLVLSAQTIKRVTFCDRVSKNHEENRNKFLGVESKKE